MHEDAPADQSIASLDSGAQRDAPASPSEAAAALETQCALAPADAGALVRRRAGVAPAILAIVPAPAAGEPTPDWLRRALQDLHDAGDLTDAYVRLFESRDAMYGQGARALVVVPAPASPGADGQLFGAYLVRGERAEIARAAERLSRLAKLTELIETRRALATRSEDAERLRAASSMVASMIGQRRLISASMALCNDAAARFSCDRVSLAVMRAGYARVRAISDVEQFSRKTQVVSDLEAAMEECVEQDAETRWPEADGDRTITRALRNLAESHAAGAALALPIRVNGEPIGALTLERAQPFDDHEAESLRLGLELCSEQIALLRTHGRWLGVRAWHESRRALDALVGPRHALAKLVAVACAAFLAFVILAQGVYRVQAPFRIQAVEMRVAPAPFDGYVREVFVEEGDVIEAAGAPLVRLDDTQLRLQLAASEAERAAREREAAIAMRERREADAQIARALARKAGAQADLHRSQIGQALVAAAAPGVVLEGDLREQLGAPVRTGDVLFKIAPLSALRADIFVPEGSVGDVLVGQRGELATASYPDRRIPFEVVRIDPLAELRQERNVFRVQVRLDQTPEWIRPGMEGVARVDVERRSYLAIWTRDLVNWVRMKLWI